MSTRIRRSQLTVYVAAAVVFTVFTATYYRPSASLVRVLPGASSSEGGLIIALPDKLTGQRRAFYANQTGNAVVGVFILVDIGIGKSLESGRGAEKIEQLSDKDFGFGNCDESPGGAAVGYRLYVVYTGNADEATRANSRRLLSTYIAERVRLVTMRGCQVTVASETEAAAEGSDIRALNMAMIGAYIDDNVDYYHVILSDARPSYGDRARNVNSLLKILRYYTNPYDTGVVVENQPATDGVYLPPFKPLAIFFSRVHFDIFGLFFPIDLPDVGSAISYATEVYQAVETFAKLAIVVTSGTKDAKVESLSSTNTSGLTSKHRWPELFKTDLQTLQRYLTAINSSSCFRCPSRLKSGKRVISMSLYGSSRRYTMGAIRNAQMAPVTYPGWSLRFYAELSGSEPPKYGAVPPSVLARLRQLGAEFSDASQSATLLAPMLWRFTVVDDPSVDVFIVRDCDSRLTPRDAAVVVDWLKQNPQQSVFHCIRDHPSHSGYSVSGGLWGARRAPLSAVFNGSFVAAMAHYAAGYLEDMNFLGRDVWPRVQHVAYCHDSFSCESFPGSHAFPVSRIGSEHLGEVYDQFSVGRQIDIDILLRRPVNVNCVPR